jgi:hypothetical protein
LSYQPACIVDLFGGSGLLSHVSKRMLPFATVVYNDYDNYHQRLKHVETTNRLLRDIREIVKPCSDGVKIPDNERQLIVSRIERERGFVDWITISSSLLFSMKYVLNMPDFKKQTLYNNVKQANYTTDGYLDGLEVVRSDYYDLYLKYRDMPDVLFIVDPPYLSTDSSTYSSDGYWRLKDYLDVLRVLNGTNFVFFTSNKSSIVELLEWVEETYCIKSPFSNATVRTVGVQMNRNSRYTDMMYYKFNELRLIAA